jgi:hypothetical protein
VCAVFAQIKRAFLLVLFLAFFVIVIKNCFPQRFYASELDAGRLWMQRQGKTLLPDLLRRLFPRAVAGCI